MIAHKHTISTDNLGVSRVQMGEVSTLRYHLYNAYNEPGNFVFKPWNIQVPYVVFDRLTQGGYSLTFVNGDVHKVSTPLGAVRVLNKAYSEWFGSKVRFESKCFWPYETGLGVVKFQVKNIESLFDNPPKLYTFGKWCANTGDFEVHYEVSTGEGTIYQATRSGESYISLMTRQGYTLLHR